jgi:ecotin
MLHDVACKMKIRALIAMVFLGVIPLARAADPLKAFPPAEQGAKRYVLTLPKEEREADLKVEIMVGKTVRLEAVNNYFFGGQIMPKIAQGWGYTYYVVPALGPMRGTLMAVDENSPKIDRFIALRGEPFLIRYNSKLPVVVYVPEDAEVRYRIWRAPAESVKMPPG